MICTKTSFDRIVSYAPTDEQNYCLEDFSFQEDISYFSTPVTQEVLTLAQGTQEHCLFVFPQGAPPTEVLRKLCQSGHAWWIWDKFPLDADLDSIKNWIHNQHAAQPFGIFCQSLIQKVSQCLIPDFKPQLELTSDIHFNEATHCVFCEAPSEPYTFKVEVFYNHAKVFAHPAFQSLPEAFIADFFHELANQFLGRLNQSVQYDDFVPDIGVPKYMGFDFNKVYSQDELQSLRVLFEDSQLQLSIAISAYSTVNQADPEFLLETIANK